LSVIGYRLCEARILLSICLSFSSLTALLLETTAHSAAGSHPIKVIWRIRHNKAENILPRRKKDRAGNKIAINIICIFSDQIKL
jgi:hypothetical protein